MHVGHKRGVVASAVEFGTDIAQIFSLAGALGREAHQVGTGFDDADALLDTGFGVGGERGGHALKTERMSTAHERIAHLHLMAFAGIEIEKIYVLHESGRGERALRPKGDQHLNL